MTTPPPCGDDFAEADNPEASIPTPPRGIPAPVPSSPTQDASIPIEEQPQSWQAAPHAWQEPPQDWQGPPSTAQPRRARIARVVQVVALVIGLVGTAWLSTDYFREVWPGLAPRNPVPVSADGTATLAGITVSLVEATDLGGSPSLPESDWQPPAGFHAWRVVLETESTNPDVLSCEVALVDSQGREFRANYFVDSFVEGYEWTYTCGIIEPEDEIGPQQAMLVLVPADADVRTVRIWNVNLNPDFIEFEL